MSAKACAASDTKARLQGLDLSMAEMRVKKLQRRIAEAYARRRFDKVDFLQHIMIRSYYAKALAVDIVSRDRGRNTVGVDGKMFEEVSYMICNNKQRGYKPLPLRRVYIPKDNGQMRPISIPTVTDRVMQTLYKFALEPIAELTADDSSFGFRPNRGCCDALIRCRDILSCNPKTEWVLKADIKSCFDNISHEWLLNNIPIDKAILKKILKCGYFDGFDFYQTERGVPQGGCLSSVICNMTLDGLEEILYKNYSESVRMVRYADDIVIFGDDKTLLVQSVLPLVKRFLSERGLSLSAEKTKLTDIKTGFTFLGWGVYKANDRIYLAPSNKNIASLLEKIGEILKGDFTRSHKAACEKLNALIRGWFSYYINIAVKQSLYEVEYEVCSYVHSLTNDKRIVDFVQYLFKKLDEKYTN